MAITCAANLFGSKTQYIKTNGGDIVAVDGTNIVERLILSDLRIPYKQILKSRVILNVGQVNYLLNFLGVGDNATFLAIRATYDIGSVLEADNYVSWSYYDDLTRINHFADFMVLTGNSTHRIPQIYLTNPSTKYAVTLDIMVGVIDTAYSIFTDTLNQSGTSFVGLEYTDIHSHIVGQSIVINDKSSPVRPLIYITLNDINSITITGQILVIDDSSRGSIFLQFLTQYDAYQAHSLLNYVIENENVDIDALSPVADDVDPIVYFYGHVGDNMFMDYIAFNGATSGIPYDTTAGYTFSTTISLTQSGVDYSYFDKSRLMTLLINHTNDNRDGTMSMIPSNLIITTATGSTIDRILATGSYQLTFDFCDIAHNYLDGVFMDLTVII